VSTEINDLKIQLRELQDRIEAISNRMSVFGEDNFTSHTIIAFTDKLSYSYCAIKVAGYWYLSGPVNGGKKLTWEQLCNDYFSVNFGFRTMITGLVLGLPTQESKRRDAYGSGVLTDRQ
jgi:hypothetical protein